MEVLKAARWVGFVSAPNRPHKHADPTNHHYWKPASLGRKSQNVGSLCFDDLLAPIFSRPCGPAVVDQKSQEGTHGFPDISMRPQRLKPLRPATHLRKESVLRFSLFQWVAIHLAWQWCVKSDSEIT